MKDAGFFSRKEQSEFIHRVYAETPPVIREFFNQETELLKQALADRKTTLEVGCGFGRVLDSLSDIRYTGIDIGMNYVSEARETHVRGCWICGDATCLPFEADTFDSVFCIQNTFGNMEGIESKVMAECVRAAKRDGILIASVYSEDSFDLRRLWYDRLVDVGIFGRVWLDPQNPRIARSDTGWSSRCFEESEVQTLFKGAMDLKITKLDSFLYFATAIKPRSH